MKKKTLLAILLVVILLGTGFAYAYFSTGAFRTEKELFLSYLTEDNMWTCLQDEKVTQYTEKQQNTPFTNKGEITLNVAGDSATAQDESTTTINNSKITIEGKTDASKKLIDQTITADLGIGVNIPVNVKLDGETLGIQSNLLYSKYIAVRNENLKALLEKFNIDTEDIPDKIDFSQKQFTQEEIQILKDRYFSILNENLSEEFFSKEKVNNQTVIKLALPEQKYVDILVKILETLRNDELLLSKIYAIYDKEEFEIQIDDTIEELKNTETTDTNLLEIKLYLQSKDVKKYEMTVIEDEEIISQIVIENTENKIMMKTHEFGELITELDITKENNGSDVSYVISMKTYDEYDGDVELTFKVNYKNIAELDNVEEDYEVKISYEETDEYGDLTGEEIEISLNINNILAFSEELKIEGLNEENSLVLNDAAEYELQNLLITIYQKLGLME